MKMLFNFIKQGWFISLLGIVALGFFIWFWGPMFAYADFEPLVSVGNRIIFIVIIANLWVFYRIWRFFKARKQNAQIINALPAYDADQQAIHAEARILKERLEEALGVLKKQFSGGLFGQKFLYQLPWYVIIGPPGAGKTTLLKNSDLEFPLSDRFGKEAIRGVGGTRNCDWWFANDAILLDTAGRYTTQDSNEKVDQAAWLSFLDLLRKYRHKSPINGVVIAISLSDLLELSDSEKQAHANAIRHRIRELLEHFKIRMPIYILLTKCDLLAGFAEFFEDLDRDDRSQVWGMTVTLEHCKPTDFLAGFAEEFDLLTDRLQNQLITKMEYERSNERRNYIYTFPQQFTSLKNLLQEFLNGIFASDRFDDNVLLRGLYFTSATQEGSPIDRIMGALAKSFGLNQGSQISLTSQGKSFFINRLLREVIFSESGLAGENQQRKNQRARLQKIGFASIGATVLWLSVVWFGSFINNRSYINEIAEQTAGIQRQIDHLAKDNQNDLLAIVPILDSARAMTGGYTDQLSRQKPSVILSFGLFQGDKLGIGAAELYEKFLRELLFSRLMLRMEQQLLNHVNDNDYLEEGLKNYLMLNNTTHLDRQVLFEWLTSAKSGVLNQEISPEQRQAIALHLQTLLDVGLTPMPRAVNEGLIQQIQAAVGVSSKQAEKNG